MPGVLVELRTASDPTVLARTITDGAGLVAFPDVPPGRYIITASREGFLPKDSPEFQVRADHESNVQLDIQLTFVLPAIDVRAVTPPSSSPTNSVRPVSMSDMLSGSILDLAPLEGDDFQSLLQILPSMIRGPDAR